MLNIKFPSEFPRTQRSLKEIEKFKANEFRNLVFYSLVYVLKSYLKPEFYNHFLLYVVFLRILTQDSILPAEIEYSKDLIHLFMMNFKELYMEEHMSFNLHAHLHLPDQVALFGPLNKISCFSFEGVFKICKSLFNGTRGITQQIARNFNISSYLYFNGASFTQNVVYRDLKHLLISLSKSNQSNYSEDCLLPPIEEINAEDICREHLILFGNKNQIKSVRSSLRAMINSFGNTLPLPNCDHILFYK